MRNILIIFIVGSLGSFAPARAADESALDYAFAISVERSRLDNLSLGDDPAVDRQIEEDLEFEFELEYSVNDQVYLFFTGALIDESEEIEPAGGDDSKSGLERKEIGVGYLFGETIESELTLGRMEFSSNSEWMIWWDEEIDAVRLESVYSNFEVMLGFAEELARESTALNRIDPEVDDIKRIIASLAWEFVPDQSLQFYYLDQKDDSRSYVGAGGEFEDFNKIDEEDADLTWTGIGYLGRFENDALGELNLELNFASVSGDETIYEFDDPVEPSPGVIRTEVIDRQQNRVDGSAQSFLVNWSPAQAEDWTFVLGRAEGDREFRQTGLQGDSDIWGELFQPELSNLVVNTIGVEWEVYEGIEIALLRFEYRQHKLFDEMRDVSIELDPTGLSKDLGSEIDLVVTVTAYEGLEFVFTLAEFDAGRAYGSFEGETSDYANFEIVYEF